ncbi:RagB/SusD family nutrient uptake outer membrane protein [Pedobacter aquatilis]|uniref:RagB/SusD family nutrient uptake outer membrane protein n=1 Tax=Pedobacter aquatilis TaxID=351343 RepID=UPI00292E97A8|nr:RagB/SusD family nutrient uptake outer membrane protein [Pedobacter aquatilis]
MKTKIFSLITILGIMMMCACKKGGFLDPQVEPLSENNVFSDSTMTFNFLNNIYWNTGLDIHHYRNTIGGATGAGPGSSDWNDSFETLSSNAASGYSGQNAFLTGTSTSSSHPLLAMWSLMYRKIRAANKFIANAPNSPISAQRKKILIAEARFLRAFYYQMLLRYYGGVQLVGDLVSDDFPEFEYKRNSYKECVDYVAAEYDKAAVDLPSAITLEAINYGRATSGACKAMKARLLITAASPLFNGQPASTDGAVLPYIAYSASYDAALWQKAADACKAVLDLPEYTLVIDNSNASYPGNGFWRMFTDGRKNSEFIFAYNLTGAKELETAWFPWSISGISSLTYMNPSENVVNAFGMANGKLINDSGSGYNSLDPYKNRDPRFYYSIVYNQATMTSRTTTALTTINIYSDANNNKVGDGIQQYYTRTGYYTRKMCNDRVPFASLTVNRSLPVIRLAEAILGYAEALNELGQTEAAVSELNKIRNRAGISPGSDGRYGIAVGVSQSQLRTLIRNEYRVEFYGEGHWYYDTRRWKTAELTENGSLQLTRGKQNPAGSAYPFSYTSENYLSLTFIKPAMYFVPIPLAEVLKSKGLLIQNPGW